MVFSSTGEPGGVKAKNFLDETLRTPYKCLEGPETVVRGGYAVMS